MRHNEYGFRGSGPAGPNPTYVHQNGPQPNGGATETTSGPPRVFVQDADFTLYLGDVRECLRALPAESVHCVVTSPPYFGLRDYGTGAWEGGDPDCDHASAAPSRDNDEDVQRRKAKYQAEGQSTGQHGGWEGRAWRADGSAVCKCGATRVDQQLGLEPTPEAFVAAMVDVFREVRRVLRADGTLWLNLGDSYASGGGAGTQGANGQMADRSIVQARRPPRAGAIPGEGGQQNGSRNRDGVPPTHGLKPKDLVGIPWRVAFALQQPYYTGAIKDERDRIWLAAMVEAEGCMFIHKRKTGQSNGQGYVRKTDTYGSGLEVASTDRAIVERCLAIAGKGSIGTVERGNDTRRRQTLYRWMLRSNGCRDIIRELYPHMVAKQHEARLLIGCPSSGDHAARAHASLKAIHQGEAPTIDFPAPASLFEPGWYLRSDVIWSKANPMPESVTDRPTKAHEYVFLLSKSPRYFFDQEAVRESAEYGRRVTKGEWRGGGYVNQRGPQSNDSHANGGNSVSGGDPSAGRNVRSVWEIATQPYPDAHFATFPEALPERCIKAGTSERGCCPECGAPWVREVERELVPTAKAARTFVVDARDHGADANDQGANRQKDGHKPGWINNVTTTGWASTCSCDAGLHIPCTVLDPFMGSGTTALVARRLGRRSVGVELNPEYAALCARRLQQLSLEFA